MATDPNGVKSVAGTIQNGILEEAGGKAGSDERGELLNRKDDGPEGWKPKKELEEGDEATDKSRTAASSVNYGAVLKYVSLLVLVLQNTSQVLVMRYATTRDKHQHPPFLKTVAVFFNEVVKFIAALLLFFLSTNDFKRSLRLLRHHFITNFLDTLKVGVPAFIYVVQNFLLYVLKIWMPALIWKILTTAMFTVLMLKRKLSIPQWIALVILLGGVAIVQYSANQKPAVVPLLDRVASDNISSLLTTPLMTTTTMALKTGKHEQSPILGFVTIIVACFLSGFAGIYFEKILKGSKVSVWLRNVQLAALSIPIGLIVIGVKDGQKVHAKGFMQGFDYVIWIVVLLQALGGLVVAVVIKYADNILKAFATSVSIVVASVASIFLFAIWPRGLFIGGAVLVIVAVGLYGIFPYRKKKRESPEENEDEEEEEEEEEKREEMKVMMKKERMMEGGETDDGEKREQEAAEETERPAGKAVSLKMPD